MNPYIEYLIDRAKERSTWIGLIAMLASFGITLAPEYHEPIIASGLAVSGLIAVAVREKKKPEEKIQESTEIEK